MRPRQDSRREPEIILPVTRDMKRVVHGFGERDPFIAAHEPACFHVTIGTIWAPILLALVIAIAAAVMLILLVRDPQSARRSRGDLGSATRGIGSVRLLSISG